MANKRFLLVILAITLVFGGCSKSSTGGGGSGGGKTAGSGSASGGGGGGGGNEGFASAEALKQYLDKQSANSPETPIRVSVRANELMLKNVSDAIKSTGKYVSLDLTGSILTGIGNNAFSGCTGLVRITIPASVKSIGWTAFNGCTNLVRVTFQGRIAADDISSGLSNPLPGDLRSKYLAPDGGPGTYTRQNGSSSKWTKL